MDTTTMNPQDPTTESTTARPPLRRSIRDRMLTGTASGIARYLGVDPTFVRIAFVVLTFMGGSGGALYLAAVLLIPEEGSNESIASSVISSFSR